MNRLSIKLLACCLQFAGYCLAQNTTWLVDLGSGQGRTLASDANGNTWNNLSPYELPGVEFLKTTSGQKSGVAIEVSALKGWVNFNEWGVALPPTTAPGDLNVTSAASDWLLANDRFEPRVTLSNLPPDGVFRMTLFASNANNERRVTRYDVVGLRSETALLQTSGSGMEATSPTNANHSTVVVFDNLSPSAAGTILIDVKKFEGSEGYLGILKLELISGSNMPPGAGALKIAGSARVGSTIAGRFDYSDLEGDSQLDSNVYWERSSSSTGAAGTISLIGTGQSSLMLSSGDSGQFVRYCVTPRAASGNPSGTLRKSAWFGPVLPSTTFTSYHIGSSFTEWPNIPLQLKQLANASGIATLTGSQTTSGRNSQYHWNNGLAGEIGAGTYSRHEIPTKSWDAVVLQPYNDEWQASKIAQATDYCGRFYRLADDAGSQFYLYQAWPWLSQSLATQSDINSAFEQIRSTISVGGKKPALIIPAGQALKAVIDEAQNGYLKAYNTNRSLDRQNLYLDNLHLRDLGAYVSALTHYATIMKRSPVGLPAQALDASYFSDNTVYFNSDLARRIQELVWWVVANHPYSGVSAIVSKPTDILSQPSDANTPTPAYVVHDSAIMDPTLLNFAFGASSEANGGNLLNLPRPSVPMAAGRIEIEYTINPEAEIQQVSFVPEWSENLVKWTQTQPVGTTITRVNQTVRISWPNTSRWRFVRIYVSKQ